MNTFSSEAMSVVEAVAILLQFSDLGTDAEHALHMRVPPIDMLQRSDIYKCQVHHTTTVTLTDYA